MASLLFASTAALAQAEQLPIEVLSAVVKDQRIADAEVLVQKNGAQSVVGKTNAQGQVSLTTAFPDDAASLLIIKKAGYSNLVAKCPCKGMTYAISPVMQSLDGMRVVLSWGQAPADLDSHIAYPGNHVFFGEKLGEQANLDVDDTNSYGPETITLQKKRFGETYVYAVHDFINSTTPSANALSASQAKVFVYVGQSLVRTYYVPQGQRGNLWTVFRITGNGDFQDINQLQGISGESAAIGGILQPLQNEGQSIASLTATQAAQGDAKALNRQGETAYHAGQLDQAIDFYRQAIELDANYGQAYGNLGLAYQKAGRTAEAIWANRKAIALASGASAATVRAGSYYNIARIYEAAEQFDDALRHYHLAKEQKANPVYDKAILRVQDRS
ncbi:tetratricopeptide repeat protein [Pseudomonas sp. L-22-4S-12]|uniref:YfaP family protein n=1 Tax=Pseudomonas sp. L-22-4S-12 TaxID=2610893 RepID=UPI0013272322|nr:tetratricopeptide repeat protein [Pseudomonas sp. L-22-4S-12]